MKVDLYIIGISFSLGLSFFFLYTKRKKWLSLKFKYPLIFFLLAFGILGIYLSNENQYRFFFYSILVPAIIFIFERVFCKLSIKIHKRDFYLYLQGSGDIDQSIPGQENNKHIKTSDILFSIILLALILFLMILGAALFGKDNLYTKWF